MAIYGINQHGSQMYINSIDDSDKLNVVKDNSSIDSGSNGISDNSNKYAGRFLLIIRTAETMHLSFLTLRNCLI